MNKTMLLLLVCLTQISGAARAEEGFNIKAHLVPREFTTLSAEMDGRLVKVAVREGDSFKDAQRLIAFGCDEERAALRKAKALLSLAEEHRSVYKRMDELGTGNAMATVASETDVEKARADLDIARIKVDRCEVAAPFSGRVSELYVTPHQFVRRGEALLKVVNPDVLDVEMLIPSDWLRTIKLGTTHYIHIDETGRSYTAEVEKIGAWIDPVSQSVKVSSRVTGDTADLRPGMSGYIKFTEQSVEAAGE